MQRNLAATLHDNQYTAVPASLLHMAIVQERTANNCLSIGGILSLGTLTSMALAYIIAHNGSIGIASGSGDGSVFSSFAVLVFWLDARLVEEVYKVARSCSLLVRISGRTLARKLRGMRSISRGFLVSPATRRRIWIALRLGGRGSFSNVCHLVIVITRSSCMLVFGSLYMEASGCGGCGTR